MSLRKYELEELNQKLRALLDALRQENTRLHSENRLLETEIMRRSAHYERLYDYVKTLRDWAAAGAAASEAGKRSK